VTPATKSPSNQELQEREANFLQEPLAPRGPKELPKVGGVMGQEAALPTPPQCPSPILSILSCPQLSPLALGSMGFHLEAVFLLDSTCSGGSIQIGTRI
jgi:hypothetical protein